MIYKFLTKKNCKIIIKSLKNNWVKNTKGFIVHEQIFKNKKIINKIVNKFIKNTNIKIDKNISCRILKFENEENLPLHNFDYTKTDTSFRDTIFSIFIFLNKKFEGGEYYFNNEKISYSDGYGFIHDRNSFGKLKKIKNGKCFVLICHIYKIKANKII